MGTVEAGGQTGCLMQAAKTFALNQAVNQKTSPGFVVYMCSGSTAGSQQSQTRRKILDARFRSRIPTTITLCAQLRQRVYYSPG